MKRVFVLVLVAMTLGLAGCMPIQPLASGDAAAASEDSTDALKAEVIALEKGAADHLKAHDVSAVTAETPVDYVDITSDGFRTGYSDYLTFVANHAFQLSDQVMSSVEVIVISPEAAMVVYRADSSGTDNGTAFANSDYASSLWQKRDGVWQNTFYQSSPIGAAAAKSSATASGIAENAPSDDSFKAEIVALEMGTSDHLRAHDVEAAKAETAEDFVLITSDGSRLGRDDYLSFVADPSFKFGEHKMGSVEVLVISPEAAIVTYTNDPNGTHNGEALSVHDYVSSLWVKRDGVWQNTWLQSSPR